MGRSGLPNGAIRRLDKRRPSDESLGQSAARRRGGMPPRIHAMRVGLGKLDAELSRLPPQTASASYKVTCPDAVAFKLRTVPVWISKTIVAGYASANQRR